MSSGGREVRVGVVDAVVDMVGGRQRRRRRDDDDEKTTVARDERSSKFAAVFNCIIENEHTAKLPYKT